MAGLSEHATMTDLDSLERAILRLLAERGPGKSICPSEAARACGGADWRALMPLAMDAAWSLAGSGRVEVLQRSRPVTRRAARGAVRIALADPRQDVGTPLEDRSR